MYRGMGSSQTTHSIKTRKTPVGASCMSGGEGGFTRRCAPRPAGGFAVQTATPSVEPHGGSHPPFNAAGETHAALNHHSIFKLAERGGFTRRCAPRPAGGFAVQTATPSVEPRGGSHPHLSDTARTSAALDRHRTSKLAERGGFTRRCAPRPAGGFAVQTATPSVEPHGGSHPPSMPLAKFTRP
jgi:hypothetical protein